MALPTNTFATYEAIGNREDLSDVVYRIDPTETPFMSSIEKEKAAAVNHEWQTQALAAVNTGNAQLEGDDAVADTTTSTVRLGNVCQISRKTPRVTGTQRAVEHAAVGMLRDLGFSDQELSHLYHGTADLSLHDHRLQMLIRDGVRFRDAQKAAKQASTKPVPPVQRPGVAQPRGAAQDAVVHNLTKRLDQTGNLKDAARLLAERRKAAR